MGVPQTIMVILLGMNLIESWFFAKEENDQNEFIAELLSVALWLVLLTWGGFFH